MALTEDHVREALRQVIDPELFVNIVDLGLVYDVTVEPFDGGPSSDAAAATEEGTEENAPESVRVKIEMTMTSPMCPAGPQLVGDSKSFVSKLPGVAAVDVKVVMDPPWTPEKMTEEARDQLGIF
ncbi:MAG TPA: hypothetical protein DCQ98_10760 [Planctomycetaceae bacterium]|nr:hypothetical protein [Planctomycetaceae bacterium]HRF02825.1 metal-sulfur cluster assembly factor [Pirellulaceae bacterium]